MTSAHSSTLPLLGLRGLSHIHFLAEFFNQALQVRGELILRFGKW